MKMTSPSVTISSEPSSSKPSSSKPWHSNKSGIRARVRMIALFCLALLSVVLSATAWALPAITAQAVILNGGCSGTLYISGKGFGAGPVHVTAWNVKGLPNPQKFAQTWPANRSGKVNIAIPYSQASGFCSGEVPLTTVTATGVHGNHASTGVYLVWYGNQACPLVWESC
jgi:hypothetical protein